MTEENGIGGAARDERSRRASIRAVYADAAAALDGVENPCRDTFVILREPRDLEAEAEVRAARRLEKIPRGMKCPNCCWIKLKLRQWTTERGPAMCVSCARVRVPADEEERPGELLVITHRWTVLGSALKHARGSLTLSQMGRKTKLSPSTLSRRERGTSSLTSEEVKHFAQITGLRVNEDFIKIDPIYTLNGPALSWTRRVLSVASRDFGALCEWSKSRQEALERANSTEIRRHVAARIVRAIKSLTAQQERWLSL